MHIDNMGIAHEGIVYIPDGTIAEHCFKVRVLNRKADGRYEVVGEEEYSGYPSEDQIIWCIANFKGTQAVVETVYYLEKIPFTEDNQPLPDCKMILPDEEHRRVFLKYNDCQSEVVEFWELATKIENAIRKGLNVKALRLSPDWEGR